MVALDTRRVKLYCRCPSKHCIVSFRFMLECYRLKNGFDLTTSLRLKLVVTFHTFLNCLFLIRNMRHTNTYTEVHRYTHSLTQKGTQSLTHIYTLIHGNSKKTDWHSVSSGKDYQTLFSVYGVNLK